METAQSMFPQLGGIIILVLVIGLFVFIAWQIALARRKAGEKKQRLISQGFMPVDPQAAGLVERITALYQHYPNRKLRLHNVYEKPIPDGIVYLFDLEDTGGEETSWVGRGIIAIVSPLLQLPNFTLMPQPKVDGRAANFMLNASVKVIEWATSKSGLERINFLDNPAFDQAHMVFTRDEIAVRAFLNEARLIDLMGLDHPYGIEAGGDLFAIARTPFQGSQREAGEQDIQFLLADANRIFTWFQ